MIQALCEREYLRVSKPLSVLCLDSRSRVHDRVQRIEHSSGEHVSYTRVRRYLRAVPYTHMQTDFADENNFKKPGVRPAHT